jgi:hypothetical protein
MRITLLVRQGRLARRPCPEPEFGRLHPQIPSENETEAAMRKREPHSIVRTNESRRARTLLFAETGMTALMHQYVSLERAGPEVHGTIR